MYLIEYNNSFKKDRNQLIPIRYDCCGKEKMVQVHSALLNEQKHNGKHICRSCAMVGLHQKETNHQDKIRVSREERKQLISVKYDCCGKEEVIQLHTVLTNKRKHNGKCICRSCAMTGLRRKETNFNDKLPIKCVVCERELTVRRAAIERNLSTHDGNYVCSRCGKKFAGWDKNERLLQKVEAVCDQCGRQEIVLALTIERRKAKHGRNLCIRCVQANPVIKEKRKATCRIRFGGESPTAFSLTQEKRKKTCLKKYGFECHTQNEEIKKKIVATMIDKYGVDSAIKLPEFRKKAKETLKLHFGEKGLASSIVQNKKRQTSLKKYGFDVPAKNKIVRQKISDSYLNKTELEKEEIKKKYIKTSLERYGVPNTFGLVQSPSGIAMAFLNEIEQLANVKILRETWLGNKIMVDGYVPTSKIVLEFFGNFWHCNPQTWTADQWHPQVKKTAAEIWKRDADRKLDLERRGYRVLVVWESEHLSNPKEIVEKIASVLTESKKATQTI